MKNLTYIILGIVFGITMYKSETASWFRIYEMFHFHSFHMYGFMFCALFVGIIGVQWIKRTKAKDIDGKEIIIPEKEKSISRYLLGGICFGLGWALAGACPGPIFVLLGAGYINIFIVIIGALIGTYLYGILRNKLPH